MEVTLALPAAAYKALVATADATLAIGALVWHNRPARSAPMLGVCPGIQLFFVEDDDARTNSKRSPVEPAREMVNHPAHYGKGADDPYEMIKVARQWLTAEEYIGALKFQVWKYTQRWPNKTPGAEDLAKAKWYQDELVRFVSEQPRKEIGGAA